MAERQPQNFRDERAAQLEYVRDYTSRIKNGEPVWVRRNIEASFGRVVDFFSGGRHRDFVDADDDLTADAYLFKPVDGNPSASMATSINEEPLNYLEAVLLLEQTVAAELPRINE